MAGEGMAQWLRSCWEFMMCGAPPPAPAEDPNDVVDDPLIWSHDLDTYPGGEFSYAVVRAHDAIEDQSLVEIGDGAIFVGVFDGHGGDAASTFVCDNLFPIFNRLARTARGINNQVLSSAYDQVERDFLARVAEEHEANPAIKGVGCCCLVGIIRGGTLHVANVGDSRVVLGRRKHLCKIEAVPLTRDDNARLQAVRDEVRVSNPNAGIEFKNGAWRVRGIIQVTKAIGDAYLKKDQYNFEPGHSFHLNPALEGPALSAVPTLLRKQLNFCDQFLIFASDGLWDVLTNDEVVTIVHKNPRNGIAKTLIKQAIRAAVAQRKAGTYQAIVGLEASQRRIIHDDISVVVVFLDARQTQVPTRVQIRGNAAQPLPGRINFNGF